MTAAQIESVLRSDTSHVNEDSKKIIHLEAERYTKRLLSAIAESGLDVRACPLFFLAAARRCSSAMFLLQTDCAGPSFWTMFL